MNSENIKIGLLGGTFDPPHIGHLAAARAALDAGLVDHVWFLPCWKHAFGKDPSDYVHRLIMCHLMVRDEPDIDVCMDEYFCESTYSVEILEYIVARNTGKVFRLILGADNYSRVHEWKARARVLELANPIWVGRPGFDIESIHGAISCDVECSSTDVRRMVSRGLVGSAEKVEEFTSSGVYEYIAQNGLYWG